MHFLDSYEEQLRQKEVNMTAIVKNDIENNIMKVNEEISNIIHAQRIKNLQTLQVGCPKYKHSRHSYKSFNDFQGTRNNLSCVKVSNG